MSKYWEQYWNNAGVLHSPLLQVQVGRTVSGKPISEEVWASTVAYVLDILHIDARSRILELCCGNGLLTLPVAQKADRVVAVDISSALIETLKIQMRNEHIQNIVPICGDALQVDFEQNQFTHVFMYFALQHFSEREALLIFEKAYDCLDDGGQFFLGDIPDVNRKWQFVSTIEYEHMYFDSLKSDTPSIGSWFDPVFLEKLAAYTGFRSAAAFRQPENQINSRYRFDFIAEK